MSMKKSSLTIIVVLCCTLSGVCQQVTIQEATNATVNTMRYYGRNNISNSSIDSVYSMVNQGDRESVFRKSSERISKGGSHKGSLLSFVSTKPYSAMVISSIKCPAPANLSMMKST